MLRHSLATQPSLNGRAGWSFLPGVLLVLALWMALGFAITWDAGSVRKAAERQSGALVDLVGAHATRLLREAEQIGGFVAWQVQRRGVALPLDRYVDDKLIRLDAFLQVAVIDAEGMLRASTIAGFSPVDLSDREHFRVHLESPTSSLYVGKPLVGRTSGKPSIQLSRAVRDDTGRLLAVVVVSMDPDYLTRLYDQLHVGAHGAIEIVGAEDLVIRARRYGEHDAGGMLIPADAGLRRALRLGRAAGSYESTSVFDGITRISSYKRLAGYPLIVTVGFSRDDFMEAYRARRDFLLIAGVLMTLLILGASAHQARLVSRTLQAAKEERAAKDREAAKADRIDALFEAIPKAAMGLSQSFLLDGLNHHLLALLGVSRDEIWGATPERIARAFYRQDLSADKLVKERELAQALYQTAAEPRTLIVRVQSAMPVVYEIQVEPRRGGGTVALFRDITAQTDVSNSERELYITLHAIGDAVVSTDVHGRIKRMNRMAEQLTGWDALRAHGQHAAEVLRILGDDDGAAVRDPAAEVLQTRRKLYLENQRFCAPGSQRVRHVTVSASPIQDDDGNVQGAVLVVRDVSKERQAVAALQASETRYRKLIDLLPCAVLVQQDGALRYANQMAVSMFAAPSLSDLLERGVMTLISPEFHAAVRERIRRLEETGQAAPPMEQKWKRLDGTLLECEVTGVQYEWDGRASALVLLQDVSARKLAEQQRDRFFELSLDLQCIAGTDGYFRRVNPACQTVLGWSEEEMLTRPFLSFIHPDDHQATMREIESQQEGVLTQHFENRYLCKQGNYRWLAWNAVREPNGLIYATARDITESHLARQHLMRAKADAESASQAKSAFLATMSHEIRTPMNGVVGMIEVLAQTPLSKDQSNIISTIRESAASLLRIIDDILDFSKIEAGRMEMEETPVSLRHLATSLCASLDSVAKSAGVALTSTVTDTVPEYVLSDGTRVRQLLYNLVGNAIKFTSKVEHQQGKVELRIDVARAEQHALPRIRIRVTDNGIGIAPNSLHTLFEPFAQAEVSTTRRFGGTGLGLAICRRIAELMGGEIAVDSELGKGSIFTVTLPLKAAEHLLPAPDDVLPDPPSAEPRRAHASTTLSPSRGVVEEDAATCCILVAEDDVINQKVILRQLGLLGYRAEIANDGREALAQWRSGRYAMILTDLHMPVLDGYELARAVREEEQGAGRIPILALTANALQGEMKRAMSAGMDGYLTKPLHLAALKIELEKWLPPSAGQQATKSTQQSDGGAESPALDVSVLVTMVGDDPDTIGELLRGFGKSMQSLTTQMRSEWNDGMTRSVSDAAHKLKSSSRAVGAMALGDFCATLENAGKTEKHDEIEASLLAVEAEASRVLACLKRMPEAAWLAEQTASEPDRSQDET